MDGIEGSKFFESVFEEDDEIESIQLLPGVPELLEKYLPLEYYLREIFLGNLQLSRDP